MGGRSRDDELQLKFDPSLDILKHNHNLFFDEKFGGVCAINEQIRRSDLESAADLGLLKDYEEILLDT